MTKTEQAVNWMINIATDNSHGYSQANRWGPDYDCSSAVISAWDAAGLPVKAYGASWTGNMYDAFIKSGFHNVVDTVNLRKGEGLRRGDVLLNLMNHTAMYIGNGQLVHARSSEGNSLQGDQSGNEIRIQQYFNYPWNCVLRYTEEEEETGSETEAVTGTADQETLKALISGVPDLKYGDMGWAVTALQALLNFTGEDLDADSEFGPLTEQAVKRFKEKLNREKENCADRGTD